MKKRLLILLAIVVCLFSLRFSISKFSTFKQLSSLEKENLESLFHYLFCQEDFSYVLFGSKPLALASFWDGFSECDADIEISPELFFYLDIKNTRIRKGWKTWMKIKNQCKNKNIEIVELPTNSKYSRFISILNKKKLRQVIADNINDIQDCFGQNYTPNIVLKNFLNCETDFFEKLYRNHYILGLFLGYGKMNAKYFQRKIDLRNSMLPKVPFSLSRDLMEPSENFDSIVEELEWIENNLAFFPFREQRIISNYLGLDLPVFLADPNSEETKELYSTYRDCYNKILQRFKNKDFTKQIIQELAEQ